jgi:hypothetical protein
MHTTNNKTPESAGPVEKWLVVGCSPSPLRVRYRQPPSGHKGASACEASHVQSLRFILKKKFNYLKFDQVFIKNS